MRKSILKFIIFFSILQLPIHYQSFANISGVIYVGTGMSFTSLTQTGGLFEAINNGTVSGDIIAMITTDIQENGQIMLNQWNESGPGNYKLYIVPVDTATVVKRISGTFGSSSGGFIRFNGADRVIIDGRINQEGRYLRFTAINGTNGGVFYFRNGATHDTIRNCIVEAGSTNAVNAIVFENTTVAGGNSFNVIEHNIISDNPAISNAQIDYAIVSNSSGDTLSCNRNNLLINNEISNFKTGGIKINSGLYDEISGNSFFYNANTSYTYQLTCIEISGGGSHLINGNYFGGKEAHCGGARWTCSNTGYFAVKILGNIDGHPVNIMNNTIQNLSLTSTQIECMIYASGTPLIGQITGNIIGHPTDTSSILFPSQANFAGIYLDYYGGSVKEISNNLIAGVMVQGSTCGGIFQGIHIESAPSQTDTLKILNNHIHHLYCNMSCNNLIPVFSAIDDRSLLTNKIFSGNEIHDLWKTGFTGNSLNAVSGIYLKNNSGAGIIQKNKIYRLFNPIANSTIQGVCINGGNYTLRNNFISLYNESFFQAVKIYGLNFPGTFSGTIHISAYGNSIRLGGSSNVSGGETVGINAFTSGSLFSANNIISLVRTSPENHYSTYCSYSVVYTGNNNAFFSSGPVMGSFNGNNCNSLQDWQTQTGEDGNSLWFNPLFMLPMNGDLHLQLPADSVLQKKGAPVAGLSEDIDGQIRSSQHPDIGADESTIPQICGRIYYLNSDSSAISNCIVLLINNNDQITDSIVTDVNGRFCFSGMIPATYHFQVKCNHPWGGVNAADAMKILHHFVGISPLSGLCLEAAKINDDDFVNSLDALMAARRFVGQITSFPKDDWTFQTIQVNYTGTDIMVDIPGLCRGDVNGSNIP